ncbi:neprilysin-1 [Nephila pilipes]|uniref:Neprilysin-1 n=1 Tax=Nephila pilipes TaxID=299642 RepID=A0A8X6QGL6_NEPPI|nr:neprilysin-1 [Nephila pilipes]
MTFASFRSRLKQRTPLEKYLIAAILILSIVLLGLIIAYSLSSGKQDKQDKDLVCRTPACYAVGSTLRNSMDLNSDPCKDFYSYCCGGWEKSHHIPKDMIKYGAIEELQIKVLHKIKASIESKGGLPFLRFAGEWGGWPVTDTSWSARKFHALSALAKIQLKTGHVYILPIIIATDPKNTTRKLIQIDRPSLIISENILRKKTEESSKKDLKNFEIFFSKVAVLLGAKQSNFSADFNSIVNFEENMLQMMSPPEDMEDIKYWYNNMTLMDLQKRVPQINWIQYIQEITNSSLLSIDKGYEIHKKDIVIVRDLPYVLKISEYVRNEKNSRQISTYLGWRVLTTLLDHLPYQFSVALEEYYRDSGYPLQTTERWKTCINRINSAFGIVSAFLYVKEHFSMDVRNEVRKLVLDLSYQFERRLLNNDWMDRKTKNAALQKLRAMKVNVGFPDWITDESNLDDYYMQTNMPTMGDDVFENDLKLMEHKTMQVIKSLRVLPKREEWTMSPVTINAAYNRNTNSIKMFTYCSSISAFPAAFLQLPLYKNSLPEYFNYAAIGSIIGHEITHGFDSEGSFINFYLVTQFR